MSVRHPALTCGAGWRQGARARIDEQAFKRQGQGDSVGPRTRQRGDGPSISTRACLRTSWMGLLSGLRRPPRRCQTPFCHCSPPDADIVDLGKYQPH